MTMRALAVAAGLLLPAGTARAQSAPTCSFDGATATLTVTVNGLTATLARGATGGIGLNGAGCPGATVTTVDSIVVNGGALGDRVVLVDTFTPGFTVEEVGVSEIEIAFALGSGADQVVMDLRDGDDVFLFTADGIDVAGDLDEDIATAGIETIQTKGGDGNDTIDASGYAGGGELILNGGNGNDTLVGSSFDDRLFGQGGSDSLFAGPGDDSLTGGTGDDIVHGEAGNDSLSSEGFADGNDLYAGGSDKDTVSYARRTADLTVTIGNGQSDDGQNNLEQDNVEADVENVTGGSGDDVLVGSDAINRLIGGAGADELFGGGGNDTLFGGDGSDILVGDAGGDKLHGEQGFDSLDGGTGNDKLFGGIGSDTLTGGAGADQFFGEDGNDTFFNADGLADTVDCGGGALDDPEPDPLDSFIGCELI